MSGTGQPEGPRSPVEPKPWIYVIRIEKSDGTALHPVMISRDEPDWERQLDEAVAYFADAYKGRGVVAVEYAQNLYAAGVNDIDSVVTWKVFRTRNPWSGQ